MSQIVSLTSAPNQSFTVQLQVDGQPLTLNLTISWSYMAGYWVMTIYDANGNLLADSVPMITGWWPAANMLEQQVYLQIGSVFMLNAGNAQEDYAGIANLGGDFFMIWDDTPGYQAAA